MTIEEAIRQVVATAALTGRWPRSPFTPQQEYDFLWRCYIGRRSCPESREAQELMRMVNASDH